MAEPLWHDLAKRVDVRDFDMQFHNLTTSEIIVQANDSRTLSHMDRGDLLNLVQELSNRLESLYHDSMVVVRLKDFENDQGN